MKKFLLLFSWALGSLCTASAQTGPLLLKGLPEYQLTGMSPNGQWACGVFADYNYNYYAFRWNLRSGQIELVDGGTEPSEAYQISNDGKMAGNAYTTAITSNGSSVMTASCWADGQWTPGQTLSQQQGKAYAGGGQGMAISANGQFWAGSSCDPDRNGEYSPVVWQGDKIVHNYASGVTGVIYAVSNDGTMATGWSYPAASQGTRVATLWQEGKEPRLLDLPVNGSPWNSGRKFSSDGTKLLAWLDFYDYRQDEQPEGVTSAMYLAAGLNLSTGEELRMPTMTPNPYNFDVFDINNAGTIAGYEQDDSGATRAIICKDGVTHYLQTYLEERGVDFSQVADILHLGEDGTEGNLALAQLIGISDDEKTFAINYNDTLYGTRCLVVKLDQNLTTREPVGLTATQLTGLSTVKLSWQAPLAGAGGVTGYRLYRDGELLTATPLPAVTTEYIDTQAALGAHSYTVTALYADDVESAASEEALCTLQARVPTAPRNFFARAKGLNGALLEWTEPATNHIEKSYLEEGDELAGFGGGTYSFEAAIRLAADELAQYAGYVPTTVGFVPMSQADAWSINLYQEGADGALTLLQSLPVEASALTFGQENRVAVPEGFALPSTGALIIAVEVTPTAAGSYNLMGQAFGHCIDGASDLVRLTSEPNFYSLHAMSVELGMDTRVSWGISLRLEKADGSESDIDLVDHYVLYDGETQLATVPAAGSHKVNGLADGAHLLGTQAVYADGRTSAVVTAGVDIDAASRLKSIEQVAIAHPSLESITATWQTPLDDDRTSVSYSQADTAEAGIKGTESNSYSYQAAALYPASRLQGYEGYTIESLRFYPLANAEFTLYLEADNRTVAEIFVEEYTLGEWNTIRLESPLQVEAGKSYRLILDCYDVEVEKAPLGLSLEPPFIGYSDLYRLTDDGDFASVCEEASVYGNWMLGMNIVDTDPAPMPVEKWAVNIDGAAVAEVDGAEHSYTHTFAAADDEAHRIAIDADYGVSGVATGAETVFFIGLTGVDNVQAESQPIRLTLQGNARSALIRVSLPGGAEAASLRLYSEGGALIARGAGAALRVSGLVPGTCLLQADDAEGRTYTQKVLLTK